MLPPYQPNKPSFCRPPNPTLFPGLSLFIPMKRNYWNEIAPYEAEARVFFPPIFSTFFSALNVSFRLEPGPSAGWIEIQYNGIWRAVCDRSINISTGHVICRQLDYLEAVAVPCCGAFGIVRGVSWLPGVRCRGNESNLAECDQHEWKTKHCSNFSIASLVCRSKDTNICESLRVRKAYDLRCFFKASCFLSSCQVSQYFYRPLCQCLSGSPSPWIGPTASWAVCLGWNFRHVNKHFYSKRLELNLPRSRYGLREVNSLFLSRSLSLLVSVMPRNARNLMNLDFDKRHKVSPRLSRKLHHHFWQAIRTKKVIKCLPNSSPQGDMRSVTNPKNVKITRTKKRANPKVTTRWFSLR